MIAHTIGRLRSTVIRDLQLERHGLVAVQPGVRVFAPQPDGPSLTLWGDQGLTVEELRTRSRGDAEAYPRFDRKLRVLGSFMAHLHAAIPPDLKEASPADALAGLRLARAFRRLAPRPRMELLRALPMAVADFVGDAFETDALRAVVAARGIQYTAIGPWSAGTTAVLLSDAVGSDPGAAGQAVAGLGGPGSLAASLASAARTFGAEIRLGTEVAAITSHRGRATGVALASGEDLASTVVVSGADPKRTLSLGDPVEIGPSLMWSGSNIRQPGVVAKVNLALDGLPPFDGAEPARLRGRIVIAS